MRTLDRETRELQEKQWIYLLHQQNPPLTRQATPAPLDLTGLMPTSISGSGLTTPTHLPSLSTSSFPSPHQADGYPPSFAWTQTLTPIAKVTATSMQFGGMVKHTPKPLSFQPSPVHFRALLTKSTPTSKSSKTHEKEMVKRSVLPKKCDFPMCQNSSRSRGFCYSHGGGRRCRMDGCANGAVSRDLCKRHGGGRRCRMVDCKSSAESGGLCYSHGGGRRCQLDWCVARAKKGGYCSLHINNPDAPPPSSKKKKEVVESLLYLSRQEKEKETSSTRLLNPYALASILN